ncbi:hypothetical protein EBU71_05265 [bacterium]|nr:hypothetical protein [Candidatus Elulimicrobium humile]
MKFGIQIPQSREWWLGKSNDWSIGVILPATSLGYIEYMDNWDIDTKWFGFKLNLMTNISLESYEYGKIFTFAILGLGFRISKFNIKIK